MAVCNICLSIIPKGSLYDYNPVLTPSIWSKVLKYYNLEHIEYPRKLALQQFVKNHKDWISNPNFANPELHIIICDKCMENSFG